MGDTIKSLRKRSLEGALTGNPMMKTSELKSIHKKGTQLGVQPFRKGTSATMRQAGRDTEKQQQMEAVRMAETADEIAQRRALAGGKSGGRQSLIKSSPTGLAQNLGGTQ